MTHCRQIMLEELQRRNFAPSTIATYLHAVEQFARHFKCRPDRLNQTHFRSYPAYLLRERQLRPLSVRLHVAALRFFFVKTLKRRYLLDDTPYPKAPRRLPARDPDVEEMARLIDAAGQSVASHDADGPVLDRHAKRGAPASAGRRHRIGADDTQFVKAGQPLVQLDPTDAKVALDQAEAELGKTVRDVRGLFATSAQLQATVAMRRSDVTRAADDLARRERLASAGAVSAEELQHAHDALDSAQSALIAAQQQLEANRARVDRTTVENHPDVLAAAAKVRDAYLTYARTELPAPVSGFVAKRAVQLGQRVSPVPR